jgi:hypothetical protein
MRTLIFLFFTVVISVQPNTSYSQNESKDSLANYAELAWFSSSTDRTPFWLQTNQFGIVPRTSPSGTIRLGLEQYFNMFEEPTNPWKIGFAAEGVANFSNEKKILFPQLHGALRYKNWELFVGRKKQWVGLADSTLGTGSYAWSTNAMPIPKIQLGTRGYVSVPFTKGWVSFNGFYSDGIMDKNRPVTTELKLHQKQLYIRIGRAGSKLRLYGGFNHQVEWGGKTSYNTANNQMPRGFKNYINVVTGKAHTNTPTVFDSTGRVGNHLGSIDLAMELDLYEMSIFVYRQSLYEDGSLIWLGNIKDGLNGVRFRRKHDYGDIFEIDELVLEVLYTKNQGGPVADWASRTNRGKDDYFNNAQVRDGWSYYDRTIGTPFIPPTSDTKWKWPIYGNMFTSNNRVSVFHAGLKGTLLGQVQWTGKFSVSSNAGTYDIPFETYPKQFSGLLALQTRINFLGGVLVKGSVALDAGDLYPKSFGFSFGLKKDGILFIR